MQDDNNLLIEGTPEYEEHQKSLEESKDRKAEEAVDDAMGNLSEEEISKLRKQLLDGLPSDRLHSHTKRYISRSLRKKKRKAQEKARRANR